MSNPTPDPSSDTRSVSLGQAARVWAKIGVLGFGGPAGQVALMHRELVERRHWIDEPRFLHALSYCTLLPGPEAQQLATYVGWLLHGIRGGLVAGGLFVLPGFVAILALSLLYAGLRELPALAAVFFGLKAAVLAVVVEAVGRIGKRALKSRALVLVAALAFVALFFFDTPFPAVILGAALVGIAAACVRPDAYGETSVAPAAVVRESLIEQLARRGLLAHTAPSGRRAARIVVTCSVLWAAPIVVALVLLGPSSVFVREGLFFSQAAVVTFGGAYAVLAYVAQQAVEEFGWLQPGEMLDGLGLAETTPGPLIMVVQFVAFLGAWRNPGSMSPMVAGVVGSAMTAWVTFVPCFLWIFLGAPYIEAVRGNRWVRAALSTITAAVVGVVLNLSVWFGLHVVFAEVETLRVGPLHTVVPRLASIDFAAAVLAAAAMVAMLGFRVGLPATLAAAAVLGAAWQLLA